jgi:transposase
MPTRHYVGVDLHRRRSVIVTMDEDGAVLDMVRVDNDPLQFVKAVTQHGGELEVAIEAAYGWYWAADLLQAEGARVHLVHPLGLHRDSRRVKNDQLDATELANRLRRGDLPEAFIAPPEQRELRELVRYRAKLTSYTVSAKAQIHAVMAKEGILPSEKDLFGMAGNRALDEIPLSGVFALRVESLRDLLEIFERERQLVDQQLTRRLRGHAGYQAIQAIYGVGPVMASIFVAEIGDVSRFTSARHLCSWAGLTPSVRSSDDKLTRGHITRQGNHLVRWAAVEAVARYHGGAPIAPAYARIASRRGAKIARVAAARKLLSLVYYGLRDGEIRCLAEAG